MSPTSLKKGYQKLHALARISKYLNQDKLKIIMKTFIQSQFNYCPLTWMYHNRTLNNKINKLHERALRIVYKDGFIKYFKMAAFLADKYVAKKNAIFYFGPIGATWVL